jgi:hypothetical protein
MIQAILYASCGSDSRESDSGVKLGRFDGDDQNILRIGDASICTKKASKIMCIGVDMFRDQDTSLISIC